MVIPFFCTAELAHVELSAEHSPFDCAHPKTHVNVDGINAPAGRHVFMLVMDVVGGGPGFPDCNRLLQTALM